MRRLFCIGLFILSTCCFASDTIYVQLKAENGATITHLLAKYKVQEHCNIEHFYALNKIGEKGHLVEGVNYKLPLLVYKYNGTSIRSTINKYDYDLALKIQDYNENMYQEGVKKNDYRDDNILWVPFSVFNCTSETKKQSSGKEKRTRLVPLFGDKYQNITIKDNQLKDRVYYLVSGHGGPDPGAIGDYKNTKLYEDEYAYDVTLRLAKNLMEHNATVYMIIRDENDGIRDEAVLKGDKDERCYPKQKIPLNQVTRLQQRVQAMNDLYLKHKRLGVTYQRSIIVHVDSRSTRSRVDVFFYNYPGSKTGNQFATSLHETVKGNYLKYRKGRGYGGQIKSRELYVLKYSFPPAVFIELGNIRNPEDQKRFVIPRNRQVVADWLTEGALKKK